MELCDLNTTMTPSDNKVNNPMLLLPTTTNSRLDMRLHHIPTLHLLTLPSQHLGGLAIKLLYRLLGNQQLLLLFHIDMLLLILATMMKCLNINIDMPLRSMIGIQDPMLHTMLVRRELEVIQDQVFPI